MSVEHPNPVLTLIADMKAKRAKLDAAIASLEAAHAAGVLGNGEQLDGVADPLPPFVTADGIEPQIPAGAFFGKSIPEAARLYLTLVKKKRSTREIADALKAGGMESNSSNFVEIVGTVLNRVRKSGDMMRLSDGWALPEWYPPGFRNAAQAQEKTKSKKRQAKPKNITKPKRTRPKVGVETPNVTPKTKSNIQPKIGPESMIDSFLLDHPSQAFSTGELAAHLGLKVGTVNLVCAKLKHLGKVDKTEAGAYRTTKVHRMPMAG